MKRDREYSLYDLLSNGKEAAIKNFESIKAKLSKIGEATEITVKLAVGPPQKITKSDIYEDKVGYRQYYSADFPVMFDGQVKSKRNPIVDIETKQEGGRRKRSHMRKTRRTTRRRHLTRRRR